MPVNDTLRKVKDDKNKIDFKKLCKNKMVCIFFKKWENGENVPHVAQNSKQVEATFKTAIR